MVTALSHELFGTVPAGALPGDATQEALALEIAWFRGTGAARDTQVRLDIRTDEAAPLAGTAITLGGAKDCYKPEDIPNGIVLPGGSISGGTLDAVTTGENPFSLALAGLELSVRRPEVHLLVYRHEGDGTDSVAWLVS